MRVIKNPWNLVKHLEPLKELAREKASALGEFTDVWNALEWHLRQCEIGKDFTEFTRNIEEYQLTTLNKFTKNIHLFFKKEVDEKEIMCLWIMLQLNQKNASVKEEFSDHIILKINEIIDRQLALLTDPSLAQELKKIASGRGKGVSSIRIVKSVQKTSKKFVEFLEKQRNFIFNCEFNYLKGSSWDEQTLQRELFDPLNRLRTFNRRTAIKGIAASVGAAFLGKWGKEKIQEKLAVPEPASTHPRIANLSLHELYTQGYLENLARKVSVSLGPYTRKNDDVEVIIIADRHMNWHQRKAATFVREAIKNIDVDALGFELYYGMPRENIISEFDQEFTRRFKDGKIYVEKGVKRPVIEKIQSPEYDDFLLQKPTATPRGKAVIPAFGYEDKNMVFKNIALVGYSVLLEFAIQSFNTNSTKIAPFSQYTGEQAFTSDRSPLVVRELDRYRTLLFKNNLDIKFPLFCFHLLTYAKRGMYARELTSEFNDAHAKYHSIEKKDCLELPKPLSMSFQRKLEKKAKEYIKNGVSKGMAAADLRQYAAGIVKKTNPEIRDLVYDTLNKYKEFNASTMALWGPTRTQAMAKNCVAHIKKLKARRVIIITGEGHVDHRHKLVSRNNTLQSLLPYSSVVFYTR
tara:strand:- start:258 stop:2153 length:1896 start_codon:yes stop_codon:yes gene_type:complete